jgi:hypothetical protein
MGAEDPVWQGGAKAGVPEQCGRAEEQEPVQPMGGTRLGCNQAEIHDATDAEQDARGAKGGHLTQHAIRVRASVMLEIAEIVEEAKLQEQVPREQAGPRKPHCIQAASTGEPCGDEQ